MDKDFFRLDSVNRVTTCWYQGFCCLAQPLDCRTNIRLAGTSPTPQQRLRKID